PGLVPLVGVDVRGEEEGQLAQPGQLPGHELVEYRRRALHAVAGEHRIAVTRAQRQVDVARVALALVELRHARQRRAGPGGDLLGSRLVDDVVGAGGQRVGVLERDLVLARVALALGRLDRQAGAPHAQPDVAQQWLDAGRAEDRVVDVVLVGRRQVAIALLP